jgi:hypothetical protein
VASFGRILRGKAPADRPIQFFSGLLKQRDKNRWANFRTTLRSYVF